MSSDRTRAEELLDESLAAGVHDPSTAATDNDYATLRALQSIAESLIDLTRTRR